MNGKAKPAAARKNTPASMYAGCLDVIIYATDDIDAVAGIDARFFHQLRQDKRFAVSLIP